MLILTRRVGQTVAIGAITVTVVEVRGMQVRIGIDAPRDLTIIRRELDPRPDQALAKPDMR